MVLEEFFKPDWVRHRPYLAFVFGLFYTFIAFFITAFFFRGMMSVAMVFLTAILLVPTLLLLVKKEEGIERKYGLKHFFKNHKDIFEVYLFSFLGVFFAFVILGLATYNNPDVYGSLFDFQARFLEFQQVDDGVIEGFVAGTLQPSALQVVDIFAHDVVKRNIPDNTQRKHIRKLHRDGYTHDRTECNSRVAGIPVLFDTSNTRDKRILTCCYSRRSCF
jgi:hypothetical protein